MPRQRRGFSLIELMVAVAILGTLSAVAIPLFQQYTFRAKLSESSRLLSVIRIGQVTFFILNDCFAEIRSTPEGRPVPDPIKVPWVSTPSGNTSDACTAGRVLSFADTEIEPKGKVYFVYACSRQLTPPEFSCNSRGDLNGNSDISEYVVCSDFASTGSCIPGPAPTNYVSVFPFEMTRASSDPY